MPVLEYTKLHLIVDIKHWLAEVPETDFLQVGHNSLIINGEITTRKWWCFLQRYHLALHFSTLLTEYACEERDTHLFLASKLKAVLHLNNVNKKKSNPKVKTHDYLTE